MQLDKLAVGVIVFFVMILSGTMILSDIDTSYEEFGVNMSVNGYLDEIAGVANQTTSLNVSGDMHEDILGGEVSDTDTGDSMFRGGYSGLRLITTPVSLVKIIIQDIGLTLGIPQVFLSYAFAALIILVSFTIVYIIFRISIKT